MEWISVDEKLPYEGERVLVYRTGRCPDYKLSWYTQSPYATECGHFQQGFAFHDNDLNRGLDGRVTHWARIAPVPR